MPVGPRTWPARWAGAPSSIRRRALNRVLLRLPLRSRRRAQYFLAHGRVLHLRAPRLWSEKVNWRMVFDRRDLLAMTADKRAAQQYAQRTAPPGTLRLPRTVWCGDDPSQLAAVEWPARWALKPNHGTGAVVMGEGRPDPDRLRELIADARGWLVDPGPEQWGEWAYGRAQRLVLLEEALPGTTAAGVPDHKFLVAAGEVLLVQVDSDRFTDHRRRFYTPDWLPLTDRCELPLAAVTPAPPHLATMLEVAAALGAAFDFVRVDLYDVGGHVWFGELTAYSGSGLAPFEPSDLDEILGAAWALPRLDAAGR